MTRDYLSDKLKHYINIGLKHYHKTNILLGALN
jgi:hypothetical protein